MASYGFQPVAITTAPARIVVAGRPAGEVTSNMPGWPSVAQSSCEVKTWIFGW